MGWPRNAINAVKAGLGKVGGALQKAGTNFMDLANNTKTKIVDANAAAKEAAEKANLQEALKKKMDDISNHVVTTD